MKYFSVNLSAALIAMIPLYAYAGDSQLLDAWTISMQENIQMDTPIVLAAGVHRRVERRHDAVDNTADRVDDKQDFREERRDCVGDGADCRSDNRQDKREDTVDRAGDRVDDRRDRRW